MSLPCCILFPSSNAKSPSTLRHAHLQTLRLSYGLQTSPIAFNRQRAESVKLHRDCISWWAKAQAPTSQAERANQLRLRQGNLRHRDCWQCADRSRHQRLSEGSGVARADIGVCERSERDLPRNQLSRALGLAIDSLWSSHRSLYRVEGGISDRVR